MPLPLGLLAEGEWWQEELLGGKVVAIQQICDRCRRLDLSGQVLLAKPAKPEFVAQLREGDRERVKEALKQVVRANLRGRSLRGASLRGALLPGADLQDSQLQGADLMFAQLQGAELQGANLLGAELQGADLANAKLAHARWKGAHLQGANLQGVHLQGADLSAAELQGANLGGAELQGANFQGVQLQGADLSAAQLQDANLRGAELQGANLSAAELQGANLGGAELQGANLRGARLQGADLQIAQLQGADLGKAQLQGADLRNAELYGATVEQRGTALVDLRAARAIPLGETKLAQLRKLLVYAFGETEARNDALTRIESARRTGVAPPILESCLIDPQTTLEVKCQRQWLPGEIEAFRSELFPALEKLACQSSWTARGLIKQIDPSETTSGRFGLAGRFAVLLHDPECEGLNSLNLVLDLAKREQELRGQSGAGKPSR